MSAFDMNDQQDFSSRIAAQLAGDVVRTFGAIRLRAFGTSMVPAILPGDMISIERAAVQEIVPGEVVLFSQRDRLFIHRVIVRSATSTQAHSDEPCFITRGDRLRYDDPPVHSTEILGRVVGIQRGNRMINFALPTTTRLRRLTMRFLKASDRATYLYVRLAALQHSSHFGRASCRV